MLRRDQSAEVVEARFRDVLEVEIIAAIRASDGVKSFADETEVEDDSLDVEIGKDFIEEFIR